MLSFSLQALTQNAIRHFDEAIQHYQLQHHLSAEIIIAKNDKILYRKHIGQADVEQQRAFSDSMPFPVASITKQFIGAAILLLQQDGKLALTQTVAQVLPHNHPLWQDSMPSWANQITIHQLLSNTSGLADYSDVTFKEISAVKDHEMPAYILSQVKDLSLKFQPGTDFNYSNTGYLLLYAIIENICEQKSTPKFLHERLFNPLNMTNTYMPTIHQDRAMVAQVNQDPRFPVRYVANIDDVTSPPIKLKLLQVQVPYIGGANVISTAQDLLKWNAALYHGKVLKQDAFKAFTTIHFSGNNPAFGGDFNYSYGLFVNEDTPKPIYSHGGWLEGIRTHCSYAMSNDTSVIMLGNLSPDESQPIDKLFQQVSDLTKLMNRLQFIAISEIE